MAEGHAYSEGNFAYVYHTSRWDQGGDIPQHNAEDLGVEVFSLSREFTLPRYPALAHSGNTTISAGATSECKYDAAKNSYCPEVMDLAQCVLRHSTSVRSCLDVTLQIPTVVGGSNVEDTAVRVGIEYSCTCPAAGKVTAELHVQGSADGKTFNSLTERNSTAIDGSCKAGSTFSKSLKPCTFPYKWVKLAVKNTGHEALTQVGVTVTLHGGGALPPTPPPAPTPASPYDPNCHTEPKVRRIRLLSQQRCI